MPCSCLRSSTWGEPSYFLGVVRRYKIREVPKRALTCATKSIVNNMLPALVLAGVRTRNKNGVMASSLITETQSLTRASLFPF